MDPFAASVVARYFVIVFARYLPVPVAQGKHA
jgi:hypothetical protein